MCKALVFGNALVPVMDEAFALLRPTVGQHASRRCQSGCDKSLRTN